MALLHLTMRNFPGEVKNPPGSQCLTKGENVMIKSRTTPSERTEAPANLNFLQPDQIKMIDEALSAIGEYGEVRLVVEKGQIRFLTVTRSFDALKWHPGQSNNGGSGK